MLFRVAVLAHILSLFFRFTLEQLTESQERQQKGKETSPAEQIGEREGRLLLGPLIAVKGLGDSWTIGFSY